MPLWRRRLLATALIVGAGTAVGVGATGLTSDGGHRGDPPAVDAKDHPNYGPVDTATTTPTTTWTGDTKDHPNYGPVDTWTGDTKDHPNYGPVDHHDLDRRHQGPPQLRPRRHVDRRHQGPPQLRPRSTGESLPLLSTKTPCGRSPW